MTPLYESQDFFDLLAGSYHRLIGRPLLNVDLSPGEGARWLYDRAPFGLLAHNTEPDPIFVYGNKAAQRRFGYSWDELTALPSRLSAEAPERQERENFLNQVSRDGYVENYRGMRVTKSGERFWIEGVTVWQLIDEKGHRHGQAAMLPLQPD
jgi:PAS domain S-box-containing protein